MKSLIGERPIWYVAFALEEDDKETIAGARIIKICPTIFIKP